MIPFPVPPVVDIRKLCWQYGTSMPDGSDTGDWAPRPCRVDLTMTHGRRSGTPQGVSFLN